GPMGAGKSTIGRQLAQLLSMDFVDSDNEIEQRAGADISWIFDVEGEDGFRKREERIINELTQKTRDRVIYRWVARCYRKKIVITYQHGVS
ncbi:shikimate kinase, partial [Pasteurella multocida subsp. multocida str. Anand1_cattle]